MAGNGPSKERAKQNKIILNCLVKDNKCLNTHKIYVQLMSDNRTRYNICIYIILWNDDNFITLSSTRVSRNIDVIEHILKYLD